jgi:glyoxylase-like metal-dependent hydrolase (beta-lactamase superfamily II)
MRPKQLLPGLFTLRSKVVNIFWIVDGQSVTVIDTGFAGSAEAILKVIAECGRGSQDVRAILVTHCHWDHAGSLAALQAGTDATTYMHPEDAALVREGRCARPIAPSPGLISRILFQLFINGAPARRIDPARVDREIGDGEELPIAGGIRATHVPGHCAGQLAFLWNRHGGVLFAADTAANLFGLGLSIAYENLDLGRQSLAKISALTFENACFGHGRPILGGADKEFRRLWPAKQLVAGR